MNTTDKIAFAALFVSLISLGWNIFLYLFSKPKAIFHVFNSRTLDAGVVKVCSFYFYIFNLGSEPLVLAGYRLKTKIEEKRVSLYTQVMVITKETFGQSVSFNFADVNNLIVEFSFLDPEEKEYPVPQDRIDFINAKILEIGSRPSI